MCHTRVVMLSTEFSGEMTRTLVFKTNVKVKRKIDNNVYIKRPIVTYKIFIGIRNLRNLVKK